MPLLFLSPNSSHTKNVILRTSDNDVRRISNVEATSTCRCQLFYTVREPIADPFPSVTPLRVNSTTWGIGRKPV